MLLSNEGEGQAPRAVLLPLSNRDDGVAMCGVPCQYVGGHGIPSHAEATRSSCSSTGRAHHM